MSKEFPLLSIQPPSAVLQPSQEGYARQVYLCPPLLCPKNENKQTPSPVSTEAPYHPIQAHFNLQLVVWIGGVVQSWNPQQSSLVSGLVNLPRPFRHYRLVTKLKDVLFPATALGSSSWKVPERFQGIFCEYGTILQNPILMLWVGRTGQCFLFCLPLAFRKPYSRHGASSELPRIVVSHLGDGGGGALSWTTSKATESAMASWGEQLC